MGEILLRVNQNRSFEQHYPELQSIINKIVLHTKNFEGLLTAVISLAIFIYNIIQYIVHFSGKFLALY